MLAIDSPLPPACPDIWLLLLSTLVPVHQDTAGHRGVFLPTMYMGEGYGSRRDSTSAVINT